MLNSKIIKSHCLALTINIYTKDVSAFHIFYVFIRNNNDQFMNVVLVSKMLGIAS